MKATNSKLNEINIDNNDVNNKLDGENINLSGEWISSFVENSRIYNERFNITQTGNKILADIVLDFEGKTISYKFDGTLNNEILNGTYNENHFFESGVISLKIINKDLLYGVTTYLSKDNKFNNVIQSPYILFRNNGDGIGTFGLCCDCREKSNNCCCSKDVDLPCLMPSEVEIISKKTRLDKKTFAKKIELSKLRNDKNLKDMYQMRSNDKTGGCYFYQNNKCQIYQYRSIDCKLFPYDIILEEDGKYYLVCYILDKCLTKKIESSKIEDVSYNIRLLVNLMKPYLREYNDKILYPRLSNKYTKICAIEDLF